MAKNVTLKIRGLTKSYEGSTFSLKNIDLDIYGGEITAYIGPNGAGKTTTIKILTGLLRNYEGEIEVFGKNWADCPIDLKKKIGYVPGDGMLYEHLTPREYLSFVGSLYHLDEKTMGKRISEMLSVLLLSKHGDERMNGFSRGMKQKVLLISGLLHNPDIIFLDEPLAGLDANMVILVKHILVKLAEQGKTVFISSHLMDVVERIAQRIVMLKDGQIVADGSFEELKSSMNKDTLERIFSQMSADYEYDDLSDQFVATLGM